MSPHPKGLGWEDVSCPRTHNNDQWSAPGSNPGRRIRSPMLYITSMPPRLPIGGGNPSRLYRVKGYTIVDNHVHCNICSQSHERSKADKHKVNLEGAIIGSEIVNNLLYWRHIGIVSSGDDSNVLPMHITEIRKIL